MKIYRTLAWNKVELYKDDVLISTSSAPYAHFVYICTKLDMSEEPNQDTAILTLYRMDSYLHEVSNSFKEVDLKLVDGDIYYVA